MTIGGGRNAARHTVMMIRHSAGRSVPVKTDPVGDILRLAVPCGIQSLDLHGVSRTLP